MFRGTRLGGPAFQPTVEVGYGDFGIGIWASTPIKDKVSGQSDPEIDPYGYYTFTVNKSLSVVPGFTWYTYPGAKESDGFYKSTFEPNLAVNYTLPGVDIKLTPKIYYDLILKGPTYELSAAYALPLKDLGTEIDFSATAGTFIVKDYIKDADPDVKNWGNYYSIGFSVPVALTKTAKLTWGLAYTKGTSNYLKAGSDPRSENTAAVGRLVGTLSLSYSF